MVDRGFKQELWRKRKDIRIRFERHLEQPEKWEHHANNEKNHQEIDEFPLFAERF